MSSKDVQLAVLAELQKSRTPMAVQEVMNQIRTKHPGFGNVPDFDFRSAILAMMATGRVTSNTVSQISVSRPAVAVAGE